METEELARIKTRIDRLSKQVDNTVRRVTELEKKHEQNNQNNENKEDIEFYACKTPVDEQGDILFNDNRQILFYSSGLYDVLSTESYNKDCRSEFVWIPCKREEMVAGDTAYGKLDENEAFDEPPYRVCKIINNIQHVKVFDDRDIMVGDIYTDNFKDWYKLVRKDLRSKEVEGWMKE